MNLSEIISKFKIEAEPTSLKHYGSGHINDTYHVKNKYADGPNYLLQRINNTVFKNVPALMNNICLVTTHIQKKLNEIPGANADKEVLSLIPTVDNVYYYQDHNGDYWRMYKFIESTRSIDIVETKEQAFEGGKAIGRFQALLYDLDINLLSYTIPDFHHIGMRLSQFNTALLADPLDRKKTVLEEIELIHERIVKMSAILKLGEEGKLPLRITHNDTKFNNILLDQNNHAQCVIDLDTVMPGYVAYDFGDAIRTIINSASEDEKDLDKIKLNIPLFEAFTKGYLTASVNFLTQDEIKSLPMAVLLFPYMQAVRFLTDYLNGDIYYKTHFADQNLQRTRAQLQLLKKLEEQYNKIEDIIWATANYMTKDKHKEGATD